MSDALDSDGIALPHNLASERLDFYDSRTSALTQNGSSSCPAAAKPPPATSKTSGALQTSHKSRPLRARHSRRAAPSVACAKLTHSRHATACTTMPVVSPEKLVELQQAHDEIRNVRLQSSSSDAATDLTSPDLHPRSRRTSRRRASPPSRAPQRPRRVC